MKIKPTDLLLSLMILLAGLFPAGETYAAYNVRRTTNADGLTNSAILAMKLDPEGFLWIGTCDGVNIYDGQKVRLFSEMFPGLRLEGDIIEAICHLNDGSTWVQTNYCLNRVERDGSSSILFPQFQGQERVAYDNEGNLFVFTEGGTVYSYSHAPEAKFQPVMQTGLHLQEVRAFACRDNALVIVTDNATYSYPLSATDGKGFRTSGARKLNESKVRFATIDGDDILVVTTDNVISRLDSKGKLHRVADISEAAATRGSISDIMRDVHGDIFVSFHPDGVIKLSPSDNSFESLPAVTVGVFCLESSPTQDVVWVGSDCQGLFSYFGDRYLFRTFPLANLSPELTHPVRKMWVDRDNALWIGTKGDGVLRIDGFHPPYGISRSAQRTLFTPANSQLLDYSVFGFADSRRNLMWIAGENGVNYYDYADKRIKSLPGGDRIKFIHGIYEENDTTLWLATIGMGVVKVRIGGTPSAPVLTNFRHYYTDKGSFSSNFFFSLYPAPDGRMLFANRGMGAFEIKGNELKPIEIKNDYGTNTVHDIFAIAETDTTLWLGTGHGLLRITPSSEQLFYGEESGFDNSTIHDMQVGQNGQLWISTNKGLAKFDPVTNEIQTYDKNSGVTVMEYSDGASLHLPGTLMFGGIDGLTIISENPDYQSLDPYNPTLSPRLLNISGKDVAITDYLTVKNGENRLRLSHRQNHFSVTFTAPDYMNASNYTFYYTLDGSNWINNGSNNTITFNEMEYGDYRLDVKYVNRATNTESAPYRLMISVLPPWYLSIWARILYGVIVVGGLAALAVYLYRRQRLRQKEQLETMRRRHKEDLYEEKLKFFTNITHEFCTPLTLMYGPCERLLSYPGSDDYIKKYVGLVQSNTERMNNLIQELIDFRRVETGHKQLKIRIVGVSELCNDIIHSFTDLAERNRIDFRNEVEPGIVWNSDFECIRKTMTNLISNAFKYTPVGGMIRVVAKVRDGKLNLEVYNTGRGIREEDKAKIFNRYSVLDNVEENAVKGLSSRNGLGLAICHTMVEMLNGVIDIESEVGKYAMFIVRLPAMELPAEAKKPVIPVVPSAPAEPVADEKRPRKTKVRKTAPGAAGEDDGAEDNTLQEDIAEAQDNDDKKIPTVVVIDDNQEILTLLAEGLGDYNVKTASSAEEGLAILTNTLPDLIISDVIMPGTDGLELTRQIKGNRHTMHVPLILLSAKNTNEEKVLGIESGADVYIGKPFSFTYLKAVVARLLQSREMLKNYYNTSASAYDYSQGKLVAREDKELLENINDYIDSHMEDTKLSPEQLAAYLGCSLRNLYRRFKEIDVASPNDYIKNRRMKIAAKLLITTNLPVKEILFRIGFSNRSHFYKEFDKVYHMTPLDFRKEHHEKDESLAK